MASAAVLAAVEARIATYWAGAYFSPNTVGDPPIDGTPFLTLQFPLANAEQISIGSPGAEVFREEGGIRLVLSIPRGQANGVTYWTGQLDTLLGHFRAQKFGGMQTFAPTSPVLDDSNDSGNYWKLSAAIPYYADTLG
jgi:hypothetical protein